MAKEDGKYKAAEDLYDEALDALDDCIDNFGVSPNVGDHSGPH